MRLAEILEFIAFRFILYSLRFQPGRIPGHSVRARPPRGSPLVYFVGAAARKFTGCSIAWRPAKRKKMADEDVQAELARLRAENEALRQKRNSAVSMKVSEKGAVSVYGLGRFPVTLYQEQWQKLLALADEIKTFIDENRSKLKVKE
jgi:hypothetical protein